MKITYNILMSEAGGHSFYNNVLVYKGVSYPLFKFKWNKSGGPGKKGAKQGELKVSLLNKNSKAVKEGTHQSVITDAGSNNLLEVLKKSPTPKSRMSAYWDWIDHQRVLTPAPNMFRYNNLPPVGGSEHTRGDHPNFEFPKEIADEPTLMYSEVFDKLESMVKKINNTNDFLHTNTGEENIDEYAMLDYKKWLEGGKKVSYGVDKTKVDKAIFNIQREMYRKVAEEKHKSLRGAKAVGQALGSQKLTDEEIKDAQSGLDKLKDALGSGAYALLSERLKGKYLDNQGRVKPDLSRQDSDNLKQIITEENQKMNQPATAVAYEDQRYYTRNRPRQDNPIPFKISQDRTDYFADLIGADFSYENLIRDKEGVVIGYDKSYGTPLHHLDDAEILGGKDLNQDEEDALGQFEREVKEAHRVRDGLPQGYLIHKHKDEGAVEAKAPVKAPTLEQQLSADNNPFVGGEQIEPDGQEAKNVVVGVQPHQNLGAGAGAVVQPNQAVGGGVGGAFAGGVIGSAMGRAFRRRQAIQFQQRSAQMDAEANRIAELGLTATHTDARGLPPTDPAIQATTRTGETPETRIQQGLAEAEEKADKDEGAIQDEYADISLYGYDEQVSKFAKQQGRDFTYTKEMIRKSKNAPSKNNKEKKQRTNGLLKEWGYTIGIKKLKTNDYEECLEIYTFIHLAKDMYRLERKWKRALSKMNDGASAQSATDLNQLVQDAQTGVAGNVGLVIQTPQGIPLGNFAGGLGGGGLGGGGLGGGGGGGGAGSYAGSVGSAGSYPSGYEPPTGAGDDAELTDRSGAGSGGTLRQDAGSDAGSHNPYRNILEDFGFEEKGDRRRLAGFNADIKYSNTHQQRDTRYSNVVATNAQGIISNNRIPNAPQGVQTIRKPRALNTTYSHRPSQARGGYKAKRLKKHKPRLNTKEIQFKMKRHRINSNLGFVNLLKQNPRQEGAMPPFRLRDSGKKLNRIKF